MELTFTQDKETDKKIRFSRNADDGGPVVGSLYVDKAEAAKLAKDGKLIIEVKGAK